MDDESKPVGTTATEHRLETLLIQSIDGDKAAYRGFLQELTRYLRARLRNRLRGREDDVEDLIQEVLLAVHKGLDTFKPEVPVMAWINAIARYKLVDHFRAYARWNDLHEPLTEDEDMGAASETDMLDAKRDIDQLLQTLPGGQRMLIVHTKLFGRSVAETATATGLTESAVKVGVHRGLKTLVARIRGKNHAD